jgi:hypothetical protein
MLDVSITKGYIPGAIGRVAELNGRYYHDNWGLGLFFEAMVATAVSFFWQVSSNSSFSEYAIRCREPVEREQR